MLFSIFLVTYGKNCFQGEVKEKDKRNSKEGEQGERQRRKSGAGAEAEAYYFLVMWISYETLKILGLRKQPNQNLKRLLLLIDIPQKIFISVFAISLIFLDTRKNCKSPPRVCHLEWPGWLLSGHFQELRHDLSLVLSFCYSKLAEWLDATDGGCSVPGSSEWAWRGAQSLPVPRRNPTAVQLDWEMCFVLNSSAKHAIKTMPLK